ncbi:MAG: helix-turn-helix transcriptional regulator, partial [Blautia sp.]|nr:helix-turn-helix transcriptional regulator [Blautia sp.]
SRTAILNGVSLVAAKNVESGWICKIEDITGFGGAGHVIRSMYTDFQTLIQKANESTGLSKGVRECRDYIRMNYTQALSIQDIARHCGYTEYYLTRKFHKETGMKLSDYIRSVRLDAAKVMLLTSKKDIQRISEELQFGSRSYFDRVFCSEVGMSPRKYRETMGLGHLEAKDETETDE